MPLNVSFFILAVFDGLIFVVSKFFVVLIKFASVYQPETFTFCFDGIEPGGVVAVSTIGVKREESSFHIWQQGMDEMIKRLRPQAILCYGGEVEYDYKGVPVVYFSNHVTENMKAVK